MFRFSLLASITFIAMGLGASGSNICAYTSRNCIGSYGCCYGIAAGVCCTYPAGYGWSTDFQGMPLTPNWLGTTYGDTCVTQTGGAGSSSGSVCLSVYNGPTYLAAKSAKWASTLPAAVKTRDTAGPCMEANVIGFTTDDGQDHLLQIPEGGSFEDYDKLLSTGNFDELFKLKPVQ